jgi:hypothetical protein
MIADAVGFPASTKLRPTPIRNVIKALRPNSSGAPVIGLSDAPRSSPER